MLVPSENASGPPSTPSGEASTAIAKAVLPTVSPPGPVSVTHTRFVPEAAESGTATVIARHAAPPAGTFTTASAGIAHARSLVKCAVAGARELRVRVRERPAEVRGAGRAHRGVRGPRGDRAPVGTPAA